MTSSRLPIPTRKSTRLMLTTDEMYALAIRFLIILFSVLDIVCE